MEDLPAFILSNLPGVVALVIAFMLGTAIEQYRVKVRRAEWRLRHGPKYHTGTVEPRVDLAAGQLTTVSRAKFSSRPLLNKSEANVFTALDKAGIGYHEVVAGHTTAGELRRLVEKLVPGV